MTPTFEKVQDKVVDLLASWNAKEIIFLYPSNMLNYVVVAFKYLKTQRSFIITHLEYKLSEAPLESMIRNRFERSIGSDYNSCQHSSIDQPTQMQMNLDT